MLHNAPQMVSRYGVLLWARAFGVGIVSGIQQFADTIRAASLEPPDVIEPGKLHRFPGIGKRNGNTAGWCMLFADGIGGVFGDWSADFSQTWQAHRDKPMSTADRQAFRRYVETAKAQADAERNAKHAEAAKKAGELWNAAQPEIGAHRYLTTKSVKAYGIRTNGERLLIPMRDSSGALHSLQFIPPDGKDKRFLPDGKASGCYFGIGKPDGVLCIAEGYATAASIHEATGHAVAMAFNAGNLEPVAKALREKFPDLRLILCADDDYRTEGNPGITKATDAARAMGGLLAVPDFGGNRPDGATDFNDLYQAQGLDAVRRCIAVAHGVERDTRKVNDSMSRVSLLNAADVKPEPVKWLWNGWLAAGKLHVLAGAPGTGKTTLALALAAALTTGGRWPDGTRADTGDVLIWSGEDDPADTLVPRLLACGADRRRVHIVDDVVERGERRSFDPAHDVEALRRAALELGLTVRLLIVDPIVSAVAVDSHKNGEVRRALQPLVDLAGDLGCAVLGISHFSKGTAGRDPIDRVTGSLAFGALARVVMATAKMPDDAGGGRLLARAKSNIGPDTGGFQYDLEQCEVPGCPGVFNSRVLWGVAVEGSARDLLAQAETVDAGAQTERTEAEDWLRELLAGGPLAAKEVQRYASLAGLAWRTVRRAKDKLGIKPAKTRFDGGWEWALPSKMAKTAEGVHTQSVDTFTESGHLRDGTTGWEPDL